MSKLSSTQNFKSSNKKARTPSTKIPHNNALKPKVSRVVIVKKPDTQGDADFMIMNTQLLVDELPANRTKFNLVIVLSPKDAQPAQQPPFELKFAVIYSGKGSPSVLAGPPLQFINGMEPDYGSGEYSVSLVQEVSSGETWDVSDAEVDVLLGDMGTPEKLKSFSMSNTNIVIEGDPKPKVSRVVIVKKPDFPEDSIILSSNTVRIEGTDIPSSATLNVQMTAQGSEPAQETPTTASFTTNDGKFEGALNFASNSFFPATTPYVLDSIKQGDNPWDISDATVEIQE